MKPRHDLEWSVLKPRKATLPDVYPATTRVHQIDVQANGLVCGVKSALPGWGRAHRCGRIVADAGALCRRCRERALTDEAIDRATKRLKEMNDT